MDDKDLRDIASGLTASKGTVGRQQAAALRALKVHLRNDDHIAPLIPLACEIAKTAGTSQEVRGDALDFLGDCLCAPPLRERYPDFGQLVLSVWTALLEADETGVRSALRGLAAIALEDFVQLLKAVGPEDIVTKALEHRVAASRGPTVRCIGTLLVRAWPCAMVGHDEPLRDSCVEALRVIISNIIPVESSAVQVGSVGQIRSAAISVLDELLATYLAIEPAAFAPVALLHILWPASTPHAVLLIEVLHVLEAVLPLLCEHGANSTDASCPWLLQFDGAVNSASPDWPVCSLEVSSLRAALVWALASVRGAARIESRGISESLIGDLLVDVAAPHRRANRGTAQEVSVPPELLALLQRATTGDTSTAARAFAQCRAKIMLAIVTFVSGASGAATSVLGLTDQICQVGLGHPNLVLKRFCVEVASSALGLCPTESPQPSDADLEHLVSLGVGVLVVGPSVVSTSSLCVPSRALQLLGLAAKAVMQAASQLYRRMRTGADLHSVLAPPLAAISSGSVSAGIPPLVAALLCRECATLHQGGADGSWLPLASDVLRVCCPPGDFRGSWNVVDEEQAPASLAAVWWLLCLFSLLCRSLPQAHPAPGLLLKRLVDAVGSDSGQLRHQSPPIVAMTLAILHDTGQLRQLLAARGRMQETLQTFSSGISRDVSRYLQSLSEKFSTLSSLPSQHLASHLSDQDNAVQAALWLHALADAHGAPSCNSLQPRSVGSPPLLITLLPSSTWPKKSCLHVVLRVDLYNVSTLSLRNLQVRFGVSQHSQLDGTLRCDGLEGIVAAEGRARPCDPQIEALHGRAKTTLWWDLRLQQFRPIKVSVLVSYDNAVPDSGPEPVAGGSGGAAVPAVSPDVWSDDDDEDRGRLDFACLPLSLPLSIFFCPFYGFDSPPCSAFPPPMVLLSCPHAHSEPAAGGLCQLEGFDLRNWQPQGFHPVRRAQACTAIVPEVISCFAGVAFDCESIVCFLLHALDGSHAIEIRSNSERMLRELVSNLHFWILSA